MVAARPAGRINIRTELSGCLAGQAAANPGNVASCSDSQITARAELIDARYRPARKSRTHYGIAEPWYLSDRGRREYLPPVRRTIGAVPFPVNRRRRQTGCAVHVIAILIE